MHECLTEGFVVKAKLACHTMLYFCFKRSVILLMEKVRLLSTHDIHLVWTLLSQPRPIRLYDSGV